MKLATHFLLAGTVLGFFGISLPMPYMVLAPLGVLLILTSIVLKIISPQSVEPRKSITRKEQF